MNQAQKIAKLMKQNLTKLDPWIEEELTVLFIQSGKTTVSVDTRKFDVYNLSSDSILAALRMAGFSATMVCFDHPCAYPFYEISLPSQSV